MVTGDMNLPCIALKIALNTPKIFVVFRLQMTHLWEFAHKVVDASQFGSLFDLILGRVKGAEFDVFSDAASEENGLLRDHAQLRPEPREVKVTDVHTVDGDLK